MARRIHISAVRAGDIALDSAQAHHARDVLRLPDGTEVEVFDDSGATAMGILHYGESNGANVRIAHIDPDAVHAGLRWIIAAAVPKGDRADWMIEKLSELGTSAFIPLQTTRSIVLPEGRSKRERWMRIAVESAKQSRRRGVMAIESLTSLNDAIQAAIKTSESAAWVLATEVPGESIQEKIAKRPGAQTLTLFVGPEGGWTADELALFNRHGVAPVRLGYTILRIETAAIAIAAIVSTSLA